MRKCPSQEVLEKLLDYCPDTGIFLWKERHGSDSTANRFNGRFAGKKAGHITHGNYLLINIKLDGEVFGYRAHRIAWMLIYGEEPAGQIDHIDGDRQNNRINNLRVVNHITNSRNQKKRITNKSGITGVTWHPGTCKWRARVKVDGYYHHIGLFSSIEDAGSAVASFRSEHGFTSSHGFR